MYSGSTTRVTLPVHVLSFQVVPIHWDNPLLLFLDYLTYLLRTPPPPPRPSPGRYRFSGTPVVMTMFITDTRPLWLSHVSRPTARLASPLPHSGRQSSLCTPHKKLCRGNKTLTRQNALPAHFRHHTFGTCATNHTQVINAVQGLMFGCLNGLKLCTLR